MEIQFDPAFVEEAVFLELKRLSALGERARPGEFRRQWSSLYEKEGSADEREVAFQKLAGDAFRTLGLSGLFTDRFEEFPELSARVGAAWVRRVYSRKEERVELYGSAAYQGAQATLLIGLQAERCLKRNPLVAFLRQELMHASDMIDPAFRYDPRVDLGGVCEMEEGLLRERFRLLWDVWVQERCKRRGWLSSGEEAGHHQELSQTVSGKDQWTQAELLALARDGRFTQPIGAGGVRCPLCHFPTHEGVRDWSGARAAVAQRIQAENGGWDPAQGACVQCFEMYLCREPAVRG